MSFPPLNWFKRIFRASALALHIYVIAYLNLLPVGAFKLGALFLAFQFAWHAFGAFMAYQLSKGSADRMFFVWSCLNPAFGYFYGKRHGFLSAA